MERPVTVGISFIREMWRAITTPYNFNPTLLRATSSLSKNPTHQNSQGSKIQQAPPPSSSQFVHFKYLSPFKFRLPQIFDPFIFRPFNFRPPPHLWFAPFNFRPPQTKIKGRRNLKIGLLIFHFLNKEIKKKTFSLSKKHVEGPFSL